MKKILYLFALLFILYVFKTGVSDASEKSLTYHSFANESAAGEVIAETVIKFKELSDGRIVLNRQKQTKRCLIKDEFVLDKDYALIQWARSCPEEKTELTAERKENVLIIKGQLKGEALDKEIDLGRKPLYIYPKYSLTKFVLSGMRKIEFWTLRRDKLSKLPMKARKEGVETIVVNGKEVEAIKVYYSIAGKLREKHYHRNYYYRKSDGAYIKKEEPNGRIEELFEEGAS